MLFQVSIYIVLLENRDQKINCMSPEKKNQGKSGSPGQTTPLNF